MIFFKDIISNLRIIYDIINILRKKGFNIPISINIEIKYPKVSYKLNGKEKDFNEIKNYLFKITNDYENQLNEIYEQNILLRLFFGNQFRKIRQHQEGNCEIPELMRFILNKIDYKDEIQEVENLFNEQLDEDFEEQYKNYMKKIFDNISRYLISLLEKNNLDLNTFYESMKIKEDFNNKGISIKKCENISIEEYILSLFLEKLDKLPIAQNVLICSEETSLEEIQSFLSRAILCEYNTLFVIELLESFSNFQLNKMYNYIDKFLSIKFEKYKRENEEKENIDDTNKSRDYLDSYIVFVYNNLKNEFDFLTAIEKYTKKEDFQYNNIIKKEKNIIINNDIDDLNLSNISVNSVEYLNQDNDISQNIKIISSVKCGLGKSFKIKKMIKDEGKNYYYFPLGGKLTKNVIYQNLYELFKKIKIEGNRNDIEYSEFNNTAIHLDLLETKEITLINEFLFSFLITKFYTFNGNIIYIPNNIKIYIEVSNAFENFLTIFGILNSINKDIIILDVDELKQKGLGNLSNLENTNIKENQNQIAVVFVSTDENITYPLICYTHEHFSKIEKKIIEKFPELEGNNLAFSLEGKEIDRNLTLKENNVDNGAVIFIKYLE